jgi:chromosome partitioning protein
LTENALKAADAVLVPLQAEFLAMEGLAQVSGTIARVQEQLNPGLVLKGVLLTMVDPDLSATREIEADVRGHFGPSVFRTLVPRDPRLAEAPSHGQSILDFAPESRGAYAYVRLALEILRSPRPAGAGTPMGLVSGTLPT